VGLPADAGIGHALSALARAVRAGGRPGDVDYEALPDFGYDAQFVDDVRPLLEFMWSRYFRVTIEGLQNVPGEGSALIVANHSGGIPYDGMLMSYGVFRDHDARRMMRPLVANFAFRSRVMGPAVAKFGGVRASMQNALTLIQSGHLVAVFPEGLRGVGKLYRERYRLTRFGRGGFVRLARTTGVPIVPVAIVGAEEIHPVIAKVTRLARPFGIPYIPITPTFPFLGPLGLLPLPTKWAIKIGEPVSVAQGDANDEAATLEIAERVRSRVDAMIATLLLRRRSIFFG
jgi:1-acyl-sn-glycerol-3-phosphate acyltransferase